MSKTNCINCGAAKDTDEMVVKEMRLGLSRHGIKELFEAILELEDRFECMNETEGFVSLEDWQFELDMFKKLAHVNPDDIDSMCSFYEEMCYLSEWYKDVASHIEVLLPVVKQLRAYRDMHSIDVDRTDHYVPVLEWEKFLRAKGVPKYIKIGETWYVIDPKYFYTGLYGKYCSEKDIGPSNDVVEQECVIDNCFAYSKE